MAENMPTHAATAERAKAFGPEKIEFGNVFFSGGFLKKAMPLTTRELIVRNGKKILVKMMAGETWLRVAVSGQKRHGNISRNTLWTTLHQIAGKAWKGELDTLAVEEEVGDEYDTPQKIEEVSDDGTHPRSRGEGDSFSEAKNSFVTLSVPAVSPEEDSMSTSTRTLELYLVDNRVRNQLWLDLDDLEWAVRFMYMQFAFHDSGLLCTPVIPQKRKVNDP